MNRCGRRLDTMGNKLRVK